MDQIVRLRCRGHLFIRNGGSLATSKDIGRCGVVDFYPVAAEHVVDGNDCRVAATAFWPRIQAHFDVAPLFFVRRATKHKICTVFCNRLDITLPS